MFKTGQISSAYAKWNEMKPVLINKEIRITTRIKFLEAYVISRLVYSVQARSRCSSEMRKLESVLNMYIRKMIKGGFTRKNVPKKKDEVIPIAEVD